jgi:nonsense-mediated mRNA decay protein 3
MSFKKFCPKCGKETDHLIDNLCKDCFLQGKSFFEVQKPSITVCKYCHKSKFGTNWIEINDDLIGEKISSMIKLNKELKDSKIFINLEKFPDNNYSAIIKVTGFLSNILVEDLKEVKFQIKDTTCDGCMKINANYREAVVQLRSKNKEDYEEMYKIAIDLLAKDKVNDSLSDTSKIIKLKTGYDLWVGSKRSAIKIASYLAKLYSTKIIHSKKLIGEDDSGERKFRYTYCVKSNK